MVEVSYIQIHRHNLCLKSCIRDFMAGPGLYEPGLVQDFRRNILFLSSQYWDIISMAAVLYALKKGVGMVHE